MAAHWQICGLVFLVGVLALAVGEDKTSIETSDETNKEDLSPEASGKLFGFGLDNLLFSKFGGHGGFGRGFGNSGFGGGTGGGPGDGFGGFGTSGGGWGGFDTGYGGRGGGYGGYNTRIGNTGYGTSGYGGYGSPVNDGKYRNYGGLGTGLESYYTSGYGTSGSYGGSYSPYTKKFRK